MKGLLRGSVRHAFAAYALAGALVGMLLSMGAFGLITNLSEELWWSDRAASGMYLYDGARGKLVPAEFYPWHDGTLYLERTDADPDFFPSIDVRNPPLYTANMRVEDFDADLANGAAANPAPAIELGEVPAYDARENAERGDAAAIASQLMGDAGAAVPAASFVGYYVHYEPGGEYVALNVAAVVCVPVIFVACILVAARLFYRRHLEEPIAEMDAAACRIAEGDLAFTVKARDGGNELDRLCATFEVMRAELDASNRIMWRTVENRRRVNAAFAHDLRTPLTVVRGFSELLALQACHGLLDEETVSSATQTIERQVDRLERYASSMRNLDKLESLDVHMSPTDVRAWFARVAAGAEVVARAAARELVAVSRLDAMCEPSDLGGSSVAAAGERGSAALELVGACAPACVLMDASVAERVVDNLLANAVRYARTRVVLSCAWSGGVLMLCVEDDGAGFDDAALAHACEPYWRRDDEDSLEADAHFGLGLNIARMLCEKHGGSLSLSNTPLKGARATASFSARSTR